MFQAITKGRTAHIVVVGGIYARLECFRGLVMLFRGRDKQATGKIIVGIRSMLVRLWSQRVSYKTSVSCERDSKLGSGNNHRIQRGVHRGHFSTYATDGGKRKTSAHARQRWRRRGTSCGKRPAFCGDASHRRIPFWLDHNTNPSLRFL